MHLRAVENCGLCHLIGYDIEYDKTFEKNIFLIVGYFNGMKQFNNI